MASYLSAGRKSVVTSNDSLRVKDKTTSKKCLSWISRDNKVSALQLLSSPQISSYKFVNFAAILGPARQGKSFLMNCLLGEEVFGTADTMGVCTKGVQVANILQEVQNKGCGLFVDTEGQGDEDVDSDTTLLTPVLLLSKVILFNWKGGLQKNQILNELAILVEVGNRVSSSSLEDKASKFGNLHILLRDFHFQGTADEAFAMIFKDENGGGEKIKERNKIREKLLFSFESIHISIFPAPCDDLQDLHLPNTCQEFQDSVKQLKEMILDQMSEPRCFGSVIVNSNNVNLLINKFVEELRYGNINLKSVVGQLQRGIVDAAKQWFEKRLIEAYGKISIPVKDGIDELLMQEKDTLIKEFEESTANVDLENIYRDEVLESLEQFSDRELDAKRRENLLAIQSREAEQTTVLRKAVGEFKSSVKSELNEMGQSKEVTSRKMDADFQTHNQRLIKSFQQHTMELDWIPELVKNELTKVRSWASARLTEMIQTKQREEEYLEKSDQQKRLSQAIADFQSGVANVLLTYHGTSTSKLRENFKEAKERLIQVFQNNIDSLNRVSDLKGELEKMNIWAGKKLEEKMKVVEEAKRLHEKETKLEKEKQLEYESDLLKATAMLQAQQSYYNPPTASYSPSTPSYNPPTPSYSPATPPSSGLKHYKGGQFTPGGGRAPAGGCYMSPSTPTRSYSSGSSSRSFSSGSSGGGTFYKGGQFTPGGGRAPKGGCWK